MFADKDDKAQMPKSDDNDLADEFANKDDIPILMDVIDDEIKAKTSQEDYLFNSITESIPVLSDITDDDVAHAFAGGAFSKNSPIEEDDTDESFDSEFDTAPEVVEDEFNAELDEDFYQNKEQDEEVLATEPTDLEEEEGDQPIDQVDEAEADAEENSTAILDEQYDQKIDDNVDEYVHKSNASLVADVSTLEEEKMDASSDLSDESQEGLLGESKEQAPPSIIALPYEEDVQPKRALSSVEKTAQMSVAPLAKSDTAATFSNVKSTETEPREKVATHSSVHSATVNKAELQAAIKKAFLTYLPNIMDEVLKELSDKVKKGK